MIKEINLQEKQLTAFYKSLEIPVLFYGGSKGGGKSYFVRAREVARRMKHPKTKGLIIRKTFPELLSNHIRPFFIEYPWAYKYFNKSEKTIYWPNGSITEFSYLQNPLDVFNFQGREYEDISMDEITQHPIEVFKILRSSSRTTNPNIKPTMILTGNPGGIGHKWVKRIFIDKQFEEGEKPEDFDFVQATVYDNEILLKADPDYIDRLKSLPAQQRKAYLEGDWTGFEGQYWDDFSELKHTCRPFNPYEELIKYGAIDWGYAHNFVFLAAALERVEYKNRVFHRLWVYKELIGNRTDPKEWAKRIKATTNLEEFKSIAPDPSIFSKKESQRSIATDFQEVWGKEGYKLHAANNERVIGWTILHDWLKTAPDGKPYLIITSDCQYTIRCFPDMIHAKLNNEDMEKVDGDDPLDCLRYLVMQVKWINGKLGAVNTMPKKNTMLRAAPEFVDMTADYWDEKPKDRKSWRAQ